MRLKHEWLECRFFPKITVPEPVLTCLFLELPLLVNHEVWKIVLLQPENH